MKREGWWRNSARNKPAWRSRAGLSHLRGWFAREPLRLQCPVLADDFGQQRAQGPAGGCGQILAWALDEGQPAIVRFAIERPFDDRTGQQIEVGHLNVRARSLLLRW